MRYWKKTFFKSSSIASKIFYTNIMDSTKYLNFFRNSFKSLLSFVMDLDWGSEMIIFESILTTFRSSVVLEASGAIV